MIQHFKALANNFRDDLKQSKKKGDVDRLASQTRLMEHIFAQITQLIELIEGEVGPNERVR